MTDTTITQPAVSRNIPEFIRIAHEHAAQERFIGGNYKDGVNACFIGCYAGKNDPGYIQEMFGLPVALTRLCEAIFERLPSNAERNIFGPAVGDAIAVNGKDFSLVVPRFLHDMLGRFPGADLPHIKNVRDLWARVIAGESLVALTHEFNRAASAASAASAVCAARAARAAYAVYAARAAVYAARAARDRGVEIESQRLTILRLLSEAPVLEVAE